jgi:hypothetical protein
LRAASRGKHRGRLSYFHVGRYLNVGLRLARAAD